MLVLLASVCNVLPVGLVMGQIDVNPLVRLLLTLVLSFALTVALVQVLRRRFLNLVMTHELELVPTVRTPDSRTSAAVQDLTKHGFSLVDTVVVTCAETTLTRPMVVMSRHLDGHVAQANGIGVAVMTLLSDDTWLVTASMPIVSHPMLRIRRVGKRNTDGAVEAHFDQLRSLAKGGLEVAEQAAPLKSVLHLERLEQATLADFRERGLAVPRAKKLTSAGTT